MSRPLISWYGRDKTGTVQAGTKVMSRGAYDELATFVNTRFGDGWTVLTCRDLDHGGIVGGISHNNSPHARGWWVR